ncbi:MmyB family transcriptional regulator [Streptomyces sp. NBC_01304]|uniref:MmyB family transcriptional regulator n=1 Tax=Streptomyces sp. NBC_01304 TaxID=2903818 RepID=UPI002E0FFA36|nr:helix-turn-helix domain-containing protein [Streptomyces sp. NBC_01304]
MNLPNKSQQQTVTRVLRQARARRNPADIPGFAAAFEPRTAPGIHQREVAYLADASKKWYGNLETGKRLNYSNRFLQAVRRVLDLEPAEWDIVYRSARGQAPPVELSSPPAAREVPEAMRLFIRELKPWSVYLSNHRWDVLAYNDQLITDYPWIRHGNNVMEWVLTFFEARTQLINWEQDWARPMIAQLQMHAEQWPDDEGLHAVIDKVRSDPVAGKMWDATDLPTLSHPPADQTRRLYLPRQGRKEFRVILLPMEPMDLRHHRLMALVPMA